MLLYSITFMIVRLLIIFLIKIKGTFLFLCQDLYLQSTATYQSAWSQSSHEDCGPSVGRLTPRPPDPSANLRETELAGAVAQCVIHDTASQDKALWHTESKVMFKGKEESKHVTQQGLSRDKTSIH